MWKRLFNWDQLYLYTFRLERETIPPLELQGDLDIAFIDSGKDCESYDLFGVTEAATSRRRLEDGEIVCAVLHEGQIASYCWVAFERAKIGEIGRLIRIRGDEVYLYDAFTFPAFRGKGFYPAILSHILRRFQERSFQRALIFTLRSNPASVRGIEKCGFCLFQVITVIESLGQSFPLYGRLKKGEKEVEFCSAENFRKREAK